MALTSPHLLATFNCVNMKALARQLAALRASLELCPLLHPSLELCIISHQTLHASSHISAAPAATCLLFPRSLSLKRGFSCAGSLSRTLAATQLQQSE